MTTSDEGNKDEHNLIMHDALGGGRMGTRQRDYDPGCRSLEERDNKVLQAAGVWIHKQLREMHRVLAIEAALHCRRIIIIQLFAQGDSATVVPG